MFVSAVCVECSVRLVIPVRQRWVQTLLNASNNTLSASWSGITDDRDGYDMSDKGDSALTGCNAMPIIAVKEE